ncbi:hypothetical protein DPMN_064114 [Dreissena polymorpha]|uniref:Uncharacterized protein n=1 Tax=Dreissena polymorpha TaxID=45954 RepID=A0A9D4CC68_DREPO|nr:hypothetical protein DPMN_064114 [Dreissena polymorpha]
MLPRTITLHSRKTGGTVLRGRRQTNNCCCLATQLEPSWSERLEIGPLSSYL